MTSRCASVRVSDDPSVHRVRSEVSLACRCSVPARVDDLDLRATRSARSLLVLESRLFTAKVLACAVRLLHVERGLLALSAAEAGISSVAPRQKENGRHEEDRGKGAVERRAHPLIAHRTRRAVKSTCLRRRGLNRRHEVNLYPGSLRVSVIVREPFHAEFTQGGAS